MEASHVNAITRAARSILSSHLGVDVKVLKPFVSKNQISSSQVAVILGINGELEGQIICSMEEGTALSIVGTMMGGVVVETMDDIGWSAIQEFGNWIAGTTATELTKEKMTIDVTPPVINEGDSKFHATKPFITLPLESQVGTLHMHVSMERSS